MTEIYKSKSQLVKQYRMETILVDNGVKDLLEISKQKCTSYRPYGQDGHKKMKMKV